MVLPVYAYGQPVLKKKGRFLKKEERNDLITLIDNMWDTMYASHGVGLAAHQIGLDIRLFMIDTIQMEDEMEGKAGMKKVFINAVKIGEEGALLPFEEGCLSFPDIRGNIDRPERVTLKYYDLDFNEFIETFEGFNARVIQHEYDHTEGYLFIDKFKPLKKRMLSKRLEKIRTGDIDAPYPIRFYRK